MGYLYRPMLKNRKPSAAHGPEEEKRRRCAHPTRGREDTCAECQARFGKIWWVKD